MILTTGKIVFVTDPDESDCYIENLRMEYNTNLLFTVCGYYWLSVICS